MMSRIIGYMEGTDPLWLTILQAQGHSTMPLGNGIDGYGLNVRLLAEHNKPDLIISYLHKLIPPSGTDMPTEELLLPCSLFEIPVIVICPEEYQPQASNLLERCSQCVELADPSQAMELIASKLT